VRATAVRADEAGLVTDDRFGEAEVLAAAAGNLRRSLGRVRGVPVVTGFIGRTRDGAPTTLGRGGSDYTAAILGAALGAEEVEIWTDVDGVLSADPRVVPEAHTIGELSFAEAAELAYFGAKVLHPKTLLPATRRGIPVRVRNTWRPRHPGSRVVRRGERSATVVKAIAAKKGIIVVHVVSTRMLLAHGFLARLFQAFADHRIVVDLLSSSEVSVSLTVDRAAGLARAVRELRRFAQVRTARDRALVSVVGEGLGESPGLAGRVFTALGEDGINVETISQGASGLNLSFVVRAALAERAVRGLHRRFFGGER
jgi:aspartate kinase